MQSPPGGIWLIANYASFTHNIVFIEFQVVTAQDPHCTKVLTLLTLVPQDIQNIGHSVYYYVSVL